MVKVLHTSTLGFEIYVQFQVVMSFFVEYQFQKHILLQDCVPKMKFRFSFHAVLTHRNI